MKAWCVLWLSVIPLSAFQTVQPPRSPYERQAGRDAAVQGRFLTPEGKPASGVAVRVGALSTTTDSTGRFFLSGLSASTVLVLSFNPPDVWLPDARDFALSSGEITDVGDVLLERAAAARFEIIIEPAARIAARPEQLTVSLSSVPGSYTGSPVVIAGLRGGSRSVWVSGSTAGSPWIFYEAKVEIRPGARNQYFRLRLLGPPHRLRTDNVEVRETIGPELAADREFLVQLRLLAPNGEGVGGAIVQRDPVTGTGAHSSATDTQGLAQFGYRSRGCSFWSAYLAGRRWDLTPWDNWFLPGACTAETESRTIPLDGLVRVPFVPRSLDPSLVRLYWWHRQLGWQPLPSLQPWLPQASEQPILIKAAAPGFLPLLHTLVPIASAPASAIELTFDAASARDLIVTGGGVILPGATVEVEQIGDLETDARQMLSVERTGFDGRLRLAGGAAAHVEIFVSAPGYESVRAFWHPGRSLRVDLPPRDAQLTFAASSRYLLARLRDVRSPGVARTVLFRAAHGTSVAIAPGVYDVTVYDMQGKVAGYQRLSLERGQRHTLDPLLDRRPRLRLYLPDRNWQYAVEPAIPAWPAAASPTWRYQADSVAVTESAADLVTPPGERQAEFSLSRAGRFLVQIRRPRESLFLWREIEVQPGETTSLALSPVVATVRGSALSFSLTAQTFDSSVPRLQLLADDPRQWSAVELLPAQAGGEFRLVEVPVGRYHLEHHYLTERRDILQRNGTLASRSVLAKSWGAAPVFVDNDDQPPLPNFAAAPRLPLSIQVLNARGLPLRLPATVRLRDRLAERARIQTGGYSSSDPTRLSIPEPPAARLLNGLATLPNIREGLLHLLIEVDNVATYAFPITVLPHRRLTINLPLDDAAPVRNAEGTVTEEQP